MNKLFKISNVAKTFAVGLAMSLVLIGSTSNVFADTSSVGVTYQGHVQNIGWQKPVSDGAEAGTDGQSLRVEALKINLVNAPAGASIKYQTHVQNVGWQPWVSDGAEAGTSGQALRVEAIKIELVNMPGYSVEYQAHVQNVGWQPVVSDGQIAGTSGKGYRIEALRIKIVKISDSTVGVSYQGHVQNVGWQDSVQNGQIAGTEGLAYRVEALKMNLINAPAGASIKYQAHVQNVGWQGWASDGAVAGTSGQALRVEAIKIELVNMPDYSVQYRGHVQNVGWQPWVNDGAIAGITGKSLRIEAIEIRIVTKNKGIDVSQWQETINWQLVKSDGVQFAMMRSSYGDGTSSYVNNGVDPNFETNYAGAKANGISVGVYHRGHATTVDQATKEANFFLSKLKGKQFEYPVCVDLEDQSQEALDKQTLTDIELTYLNIIKQAGYYPMIYANSYWFNSKLDDTRLTAYDHWLAQWSTPIAYNGAIGIWQYSSTGTVKGINGNVDTDNSYVDYASKIKALHLNGF